MSDYGISLISHEIYRYFVLWRCFMYSGGVELDDYTRLLPENNSSQTSEGHNLKTHNPNVVSTEIICICSALTTGRIGRLQRNVGGCYPIQQI